MTHAILAAVTRYPFWPDRDLDGPLNDLMDFGTWLLDPNGGAIDPATAPEFVEWLKDPASPKAPLSAAPESAIQFFVSPAAGVPLDKNKPVPQAADVELALRRLRRDGLAKPNAAGEPRIGKRLYLYFAGHGFAPDRRDTALFMADSEPNLPSMHVVGKAYAEYFIEGNFFDDAMVVMDCCRSDGTMLGYNSYRFSSEPGPRPARPRKPFCAFAASWDQKSREELHNGQVRGVFTRLLLEGLRGAALRDKGHISADALERWVLDRIAAVPGDQVPEFDFDRMDGHVLAKPAPRAPNLTIRVAGDGQGDVVLIGGPNNAANIQPTNRAGALWSYTLEPGLYMASILGTNRQQIIRETMLGGTVDL